MGRRKIGWEGTWRVEMEGRILTRVIPKRVPRRVRMRHQRNARSRSDQKQRIRLKRVIPKRVPRWVVSRGRTTKTMSNAKGGEMGSI